MLKLRARAQFIGRAPDLKSGSRVVRVVADPEFPRALRSSSALVWPGQIPPPPGFFALLLGPGSTDPVATEEAIIQLPADMGYLRPGDLIRIFSDGWINAVYRQNASINALLVTEQCNSFCVMCSQPPKVVDDSHLVDQWLETIPLIPETCRELVITGGEPTLLGERLIGLVRSIRSYLPNTALHILTNGRNLKDPALAQRLAEVRHPDLMLGIPLYSDVGSIHDFVVQADGAYDETILGICNAKRYKLRVEIRVVIHRETYARLPKLAEFIVRNLQFVDQVSLMGLELMGFARANLDPLWIDPLDYQEELAAAVNTLMTGKVKVMIFNHQLCVLRPALRAFAVKSISDWKNDYMPECASCLERGHGCGGFFTSARIRHSRGIVPIL